MTLKQKIAQAYLKGEIKNEEDLKSFVAKEELNERLSNLEASITEKVEGSKTDTSVLEAEIKGISEKNNEDTEIELIIE